MPTGYPQGNFCFIPIRCRCKRCDHFIKLDKSRLAQYERRGYPQYIQGHQHWGSNNPMSRDEIRAKLRGRKRPDFSEWLKIHNPLRNKETAKKVSESQKGSKNHRFGKKWSPEEIEKISKGLVEWHRKRKLMMETSINVPEVVPEVVPDSLIQPHITAQVEVPVSISIPSVVSPIPAPMEPKPVIVPVLSEAEKLQAIFKKLEEKRLQKIAEYKAEPIKEQKVAINYNKRNIMCIREGKKLQNCNKELCKEYDFCHTIHKSNAKSIQSAVEEAYSKQLSGKYCEV